MRILVATNHLQHLGGSETATYSIVEELASRGHNITVFTFVHGEVSSRICKYAQVLDEDLKDRYDLILVNHNTCLKYLDGIKGFKIFTSHGVAPDLEQPIPGADAYVSISKEVETHLRKLGFESTIIHNGVNCNRFIDRTAISPKLNRVFSLCQDPSATEMVRSACSIVGAELIHTDSGKPEWEIEKYMNKADLIVSIGRGVLEGMACGREVLIYDNRSWSNNSPHQGGGIVRGEMIDQVLETNMTGRGMGITFNEPELLADEMTKYRSFIGGYNRTIALLKFNIVDTVDKYISIFKFNTNSL